MSVLPALLCSLDFDAACRPFRTAVDARTRAVRAAACVQTETAR